MEEFQHRDLFKIVADAGGLSEADARPLFSQMLSCVRSLHDAGICHGDLGIESFVFARGASNLSLIHMHSSHQYPWDEVEGCFDRSKPPSQSKNVNYLYVPPEKVGSFEADMWSLGVCLFAMLQNVVPVYNRKSTAPLSRMLDKNFSPELIDLIDGLLAFDPQQRLCSMRAQKHSWVVGNVRVKRATCDASTTSLPSQRRQRRQRQCVQCGTTETRAWRCQGTVCNACGLRKPSGISKLRQQQMEDQLLAAGFTIERKPHANQTSAWVYITSPHGIIFYSIKSAYRHSTDL